MESPGYPGANVVTVAALRTFAEIVAVSIIIAAVILLILICTKSVSRRDIGRIFVLLGALALFGGIAGYAGGMSREAAVGDIIPAVLGLAGGLAAYLFGVDSSRGAIASIGLVAFTTSLFFAYSFGADRRAVTDRNSDVREACFNLFFDPATYASPVTLRLANGPENMRISMCGEFWRAGTEPQSETD